VKCKEAKPKSGQHGVRNNVSFNGPMLDIFEDGTFKLHISGKTSLIAEFPAKKPAVHDNVVQEIDNHGRTDGIIQERLILKRDGFDIAKSTETPVDKVLRKGKP